MPLETEIIFRAEGYPNSNTDQPDWMEVESFTWNGEGKMKPFLRVRTDCVYDTVEMDVEREDVIKLRDALTNWIDTHCF